MTKVAIFVERQAELIFLRNILFQIFSEVSFNFECMELRKEKLHNVPYALNNQDPIIYFLIIDVGNDDKVLSAIKDRKDGLLGAGFDKIWGLRDMYCDHYRKKSNGIIDSDLNEKIIKATNNEINKFASAPNKIKIYFAIMEIEAWWLSMHTIFIKINNNLTLDAIHEHLGIRLSTIDPETYFFHPSVNLNAIMNIIGSEYKKKKSNAESITTKIALNDINELMESDKSKSFKSFYSDLMNLIPGN